jgi:ATP-dependent RNA helicase DDX52/ROK1
VLKEGELPSELDFFKYATAEASKRKHSGPSRDGKRKRHRKEEIDSWDANAEDEGGSGNDITGEHSSKSPMLRHRITTKGNNPPNRVDTFDELSDQYRIHSQLMGNLKRYGYKHPTGIQSAGCPILLEVSSSVVLRQPRPNDFSLVIWLLYPPRAREKHYPTFCQL